MRSAALSLVLALPALSVSAGVTTTFFPAAAFNANTSTMNATLGIAGFAVETFESLSLMSGLAIVVSGQVPTTTFSSALPNLFSEAPCGAVTANSMWDGTHGVINTPTNTLSNCSSPVDISTLMTVNYAPGASSLGIGFGNFQSLGSSQSPITNHELFVNGQDLGVLETLAGASWSAGFSRNGYLRIDGTNGTLITSVAIQNLTGRDVLILDHIAVGAVPEPSSFVLYALGLGVLVRKRLLS